MGCFNISCFVSRQTIAPDDECVVIPISQQQTYRPVELTLRDAKYSAHGIASSTCYPSRFWRPVGGFLTARYADYGRVELKDTAANRFRLNEFLRDAVRNIPVAAAGENSHHEPAFDLVEYLEANASELLQHLGTRRSDASVTYDSNQLFAQGLACWTHLADHARLHRLFWQSYTGAVRPLDFAIMHRATYDALVARTCAASNWEGESLDMRAFFDRTLAKANATLAELTAEAGAEGSEESVRSLRFRAFDSFRDAMKSVGSSDNSSYPQEHVILHELQERYWDGRINEDKFFEVLKPWLADRYSLAAMEDLNVHFEPFVVAAQDYQNEVGQAYATFVGQVSQTVTRERYAGSFGLYLDYNLTVREPDAFYKMAKAARGYDGHLSPTAFKADPVHPGYWRASFQATMELEHLQDFLQAYAEEDGSGHILRDTLATGLGD